MKSEETMMDLKIRKSILSVQLEQAEKEMKDFQHNCNHADASREDNWVGSGGVILTRHHCQACDKTWIAK